MFVFLAYEYEFVDCNGEFFMYNMLTEKVYSIEKQYIPIIKMIASAQGVEVKVLKQEFGLLWSKFREVLEHNFAIVYSIDNKHPFFDSWDYGAKRLQKKTGESPLVIRQLTVQLENSCSLHCADCSSQQIYPCLVCKTTKQYKEERLSEDQIITAILRFCSYGLLTVLFQGGDPLSRIDEVIAISSRVRSTFPFVKFSLVTNGLLLVKHPQYINTLKNAGVTIRLVTISAMSSRQEKVRNLLNDENMKYEEVHRHSFQDRALDPDPPRTCAYAFRSDFVSPPNLFRNTIYDNFNICIYGKAYLSFTGEVAPCCGLHEEGAIAGNVIDTDFGRLASNLWNIWGDSQLNNLSCLKCRNRSHCGVCLLRRAK